PTLSAIAVVAPPPAPNAPGANADPNPPKVGAASTVPGGVGTTPGPAAMSIPAPPPVRSENDGPAGVWGVWAILATKSAGAGSGACPEIDWGRAVTRGG